MCITKGKSCNPGNLLCKYNGLVVQDIMKVHGKLPVVLLGSDKTERLPSRRLAVGY
jgi:hypothetical protein